MTAPTLQQRISSLLREAAEVYQGTAWGQRFLQADAATEGPLRVAVAGLVKAGKSTLINALVGQLVAATDAAECTRVITEYSYGENLGVRGQLAGAGQLVPLDAAASSGRLEVTLGGRPARDFARILVTLPNRRLEGLTVIDTPGLSSMTAELDALTRRFLTGDQESATSPDAVLYLMRQLHASDTAFLEAFRDPAARDVPPVNALGLLSRADEVGGGRDDALEVASDLASDYSREPRLRPYVQTVLPVAGLLAECAATMTDGEYADLAALAAMPASLTDALLLTGDRFLSGRRSITVDRAAREHLLDRLGLYGLRWALPQLRGREQVGRADLCATLSAHSGLDRVRELLRSQILERRDVLKADAAMRLVHQATTGSPVPGGHRIASLAERLRLSVPDFQELQLLNDLRIGVTDINDVTRERMERLLGAGGRDARTRLALAPTRPATDVREALLVEHAYWQRLATDVLVPPATARAATVVQRALEQVYRQLDQQRADEPLGPPPTVLIGSRPASLPPPPGLASGS